MSYDVRQHDAAHAPANVGKGSFHACITSPPYFGLRSYGGGKSDWPEIIYRPMPGLEYAVTVPAMSCQLGNEADPLHYIGHLVHVFRWVRPLLRADGTAWLNLGDSYVRSTGRGDNDAEAKRPELVGARSRGVRPTAGLPEGNLFGIPWRAAFALQADGWILRSSCVWVKPNAMPSSADSRPGYGHEDFFMLAKAPDYYFDMDAVRRPVAASTTERDRYSRVQAEGDGQAAIRHDHETVSHPAGRYWRTTDALLDSLDCLADAVDEMQGIVEAGGLLGADRVPAAIVCGLQPYRGSHYATFPPRLVEPIIRAATSEKGCCPRCRAPWRRQVERAFRGDNNSTNKQDGMEKINRMDWEAERRRLAIQARDRFLGWAPSCGCRQSCDCGSADVAGAIPGCHGEHCAGGQPPKPVPCAVLDIFGGAGTVGVVAEALGRNSLLLDADPEQVKDALHRLARPLAAPRRARKPVQADAHPMLFGDES